METLTSRSGWEVVEAEWPDFKGPVFKNRPKNVVELLQDTVTQYPDREGFIGADWRLTYRQFDRIVNRIAAGLEQHGIRRGDHVAVLLGVQVEMALSFFAVMKLGAILVPLNTRFKGEELAYEINDSESKALIVDEEFWPTINSVRGQLAMIENIFVNGADAPAGTLPFALLSHHKETGFTQAALTESDDAAIMYTSGTTGKPKGAILHQRGFVLTAMLLSDFLQYEPRDKMICCVPLFHVTGLAMVMLSPIFSGVGAVYLRAFKTKDFLEIMSRQKVTHYTGVINVIWLMINHPEFGKYDFSSFRFACFGGSPASEEMVRGIMSKLPNLKMSVGYGLTESHAMVSTTPYADALRKIKAAGKLLALGDAKIVDDDGNALPRGSTGEILLKGAKVFKGYWKKPAATKQAMVDGWLRTGDIGKIDDEGFLYILDRKKDMINRGGEKIFSLEVENLIFNYPKVLEVAVVGVPDSVLGEAVKAVIALKQGETATPEEIRKFCAEHLADYKVPQFVEFVASLPRNPAGKVVKADLRYSI
ncbi:MAG: class I adenylate-forming enzyme family protein [Burkholderiales bacterium]